MLSNDEKLLREKIRSVICAQDSVTHMNEQGPEYEAVTKELIAERNQLIDCVVRLVDRMVHDAAQQSAQRTFTGALHSAGTCLLCGSPVEDVRPGRTQCPKCGDGA
jgi:rubrerythrin